MEHSLFDRREMQRSGRAMEKHQTRARLRLRLTPAAETAVRSGHPWVFDGSIREQNRPGELGELAVIYDRRDRFLALALFDPTSPIRCRVLHVGKPQAVDADWWSARLVRAFERRKNILDSETTGCRCVHGESDGWPGFVLDLYEETLVLKLYTAAWLPQLDETISMLTACLQPRRMVLRLSRNIQKLAGEQFGRHDGQVLSGPPVVEPIVFKESGLRFEAEVLQGQKTGFFLDQRENRRTVQSLAAGRNVLNAFSFSGAFSIYAARGGAATATELDISAHALKSAERNFRLNSGEQKVGACRFERLQADAFDWFGSNPGRKFELVVLDPPSLARRAAERERAIKSYHRLAGSAIRCLSPGGILMAASCSAHVTPEEFFEAVRSAARQSGRKFNELRTTGHPADHPATFAEAVYLKAIYLEFR
jgi:23S rRNA (cytosine1962-C5)-methyltransferase